MVAYYKLVHGEPEYRAQMLVRADGKWIKRADYEADLAAARAEIERLTKERDAQYEENVNRIAMQAKAEAERDEALALLADAYGAGTGGSVIEAHLADAERDMRQRAADYLQSAADDWRSDGHEHEAKKIEDEIPGVLALPLKHADRKVKQ